MGRDTGSPVMMMEGERGERVFEHYIRKTFFGKVDWVAHYPIVVLKLDLAIDLI